MSHCIHYVHTSLIPRPYLRLVSCPDPPHGLGMRLIPTFHQNQECWVGTSLQAQVVRPTPHIHRAWSLSHQAKTRVSIWTQREQVWSKRFTFVLCQVATTPLIATATFRLTWWSQSLACQHTGSGFARLLTGRTNTPFRMMPQDVIRPRTYNVMYWSVPMPKLCNHGESLNSKQLSSQWCSQNVLRN